ncbi:MAG: DUF1552 domain-containing protein [Nannocystales bacterium]
MHYLKLSRRSILAGMGASVALLPFTVRGGGEPGAIRRFVSMYSSNGVHPSWGASGSGNAMVLSESLSPLEAHRDRIAVVEGIQFRAFTAPEHYDGTVGSLSGVASSNPQESYGQSISIDQVIADLNTPLGGYRSLNGCLFFDGENRYSFTEAGGNVPHEQDPAQIFNAMFSGFIPPEPGGPAEPDPNTVRRLALQQRVVDTVHSDFSRVRDRLGGDDRLLIERHIDSLNELAVRLDNQDLGSGAGAGCDPIDPGDISMGTSSDELIARARAHIDVAAMALACDRTRVASLAMGYISGGISGHHEASHSSDYDAGIQYDQFYAARFAELIDALEAVGVLDGTLVYWFNELGKYEMEGNVADHGVNDMPYVFAGGLASVGRSFQIGGSPNHNYLLAGILQQFDIDSDFFGDDDLRQSGQSAITEVFAS